MLVRLKEALKQNRVVRVFALGQLCGPKLVEMVGFQGGYDAVWLDQEHVGLTVEQIEHSARAARAVGLDSFVRLTPTDYATVMRPLEAGAGGIMAAQVRSAKEAADIVRWAKFHPLGLRGVNGSGVDNRYGSYGGGGLKDYFQRANAETFIAIQIENTEALEDVEKIAAVKEVDVLFVGPGDLGQSLGIPGDWDQPRMWQALEKVAKAARDHGIHWAILPPTPDYAKRCVALGCRMLSIGLDTWTMAKGLKAYRTEYADYFD